jgi:hypothetical protein
MSIFSGYTIFNDPDKNNSVYIIASEESIVYVSLNESKAQENFELLNEVFNKTRDENLILYEVPLDNLLLEPEEALCLKMIILEQEGKND